MEFSERVRGAHRGLFAFAFALLCDFCFCSCAFARTLHLTFASLSFGIRQAKEKSPEKNLGGCEKLLRRIFAPEKNLGGCEKLLGKIFAPDKNSGGLEKLLRKSLRQIKF
jgi:hypothetical protein